MSKYKYMNDNFLNLTKYARLSFERFSKDMRSSYDVRVLSIYTTVLINVFSFNIIKSLIKLLLKNNICVEKIVLIEKTRLINAFTITIDDFLWNHMCIKNVCFKYRLIINAINNENRIKRTNVDLYPHIRFGIPIVQNRDMSVSNIIKTIGFNNLQFYIKFAKNIGEYQKENIHYCYKIILNPKVIIRNNMLNKLSEVLKFDNSYKEFINDLKIYLFETKKEGKYAIE